MNIAIAGFGLEGRSNYNYFAAKGHSITILDERAQIDDLPTRVPVVTGAAAFTDLGKFDMVIRTAGLSPVKLKNAKTIWSATNEFFDKCPAPIIGVTGSKGKGTTASFIAEILRQAGKNVHLLGNIGLPALDVLPKIKRTDIVVYELSSFQLWDAQKSPSISVVLMIEPDHLDVHASFEEYVAAKSVIAKYQQASDTMIYFADNKYSRAIAEISPANKIAFPNNRAVHIKDDYFWYGTEKICPTSAVQLPGLHNLMNACAAITAAWQLTHNIDAIEKGLKHFAGLPHRLKYVATVNEVRYYDDSIATTPGSAVAAIRSFREPKVLILGGSSKNADFAVLTDEIKRSLSTIRAAILIGEEADAIEALLNGTGVTIKNLGKAISMDTIVVNAARCAMAGDVVLLSPACASFGMFKNYSDRGDQFIKAVRSL